MASELSSANVQVIVACTLTPFIAYGAYKLWHDYRSPHPWCQDFQAPENNIFLGSLRTVMNPNAILTRITSFFVKTGISCANMRLGLNKHILLVGAGSQGVYSASNTRKSENHYFIFRKWFGDFFYKDKTKTTDYKTSTKIFLEYMDYEDRHFGLADAELELLIQSLEEGEQPIYKLTSSCILNIVYEIAFGSKRGTDVTIDDVLSLHTVLKDHMYSYWKRPLLFIPGIRTIVEWLSFRGIKKLSCPHNVILQAATRNGHPLPADGCYFLNYISDIFGEDGPNMTEYFIFNAHEKITTAIIFTLHVLGWHKDLQNTAYVELRTILGNGSPRIHNIQNLTILDKIIKETFRAYPPVPILYKKMETVFQTAEDWSVPKNTEMWLHLYANLREANANQGFNRDFTLQSDRMPSFVFGDEKNGCPGMEFAMRTIKLAVAKIIRVFAVECLVSEDELELSAETVLRATNYKNIRLTRRPLNMPIESYMPLAGVQFVPRSPPFRIRPWLQEPRFDQPRVELELVRPRIEPEDF